MAWAIGIDIGGTFTDCVAISDSGDVHYAKAPSSPGNLLEGILGSLHACAEVIGAPLESVMASTRLFAHGTTATTNAVIERKGVKTGFITTRGFRDHVLVLKGERGAGQPLQGKLRFSRVEKPAPIVPSELTEEVTERIDYKGEVLASLDVEEAREIVARLRENGVRSIAISLLSSYRNPAHERQLQQIVKEIDPGIFTAVSSEILPIRGEYQRSVTTIVSAYVGPLLEDYVSSLKDALSGLGCTATPLIMQSVGGVVPAGQAVSQAAATLNSGPAGGIIAVKYLADMLGYKNIIATDVGGTSFDVGLIIDAEPLVTTTSYIPEVNPYHSRYRIALPSLDIQSIGTGGGSIAWLANGVIKVGPQSAGARPGPACFDQGGTEPTVTDADVVLGYVDPSYFLGGSMVINKEKAIQAVREKIAEPLGLSVNEAAAAICRVSNSQMADLIRRETVERGYDPRDCVVFAYGGAGPTHCAAYTADLGVERVIVPSELSTVFSAFGIAVTDLRFSAIRSDYLVAPFDLERIRESFDELEREPRATMSRWGVAEDDTTLLRSVDMCYAKQTRSLTVPLDRDEITQDGLDRLVARFEEKYQSLYGSGTTHVHADVGLVNFRVDAVGRTPKPRLRERPDEGADASPALKGRRMAYFDPDGEVPDVPVYQGELLRAGNRMTGPAIVEYRGTTAVVQPGQICWVDGLLDLVIEVKPESALAGEIDQRGQVEQER